MNKIKVLILYRGEASLPRGTPIRVANFVRCLDKEKTIDLCLFSWDKIFLGIKKHYNLTNNHVKDLWRLISYIRINKIEVVVGYIASSLYYLVPIKIFTNAKIIYECQGFIENEARAYNSISFSKFYLQKMFFGLAYRVCNLIVTSEGPSTIQILKRYNSHVVDLYGGIDLNVFCPDFPSGNYIKKDGRIVIGYAGNARIWQGLDFLIDAYRKLLEIDHNFRLALLLSENKNYGSDIEVFGPLANTQVPGFLVDCDILVIPRPDIIWMRNAVSGKLIEYLGIGKPIISSRVGDADKILKSGVNGLIYIPGDTDDFIKCVLTLRDEKLRREFGNKATLLAKEYTWEILSKRLVDEIHRLV